MVCPGVLIGLFLFSLTSSGVSAVEVNQNTLAKIIHHIETNYQPRVQYAVAINVPKEKCLNEFREDDFLKEDGAKNVKKALGDEKLYKGQQLVAALPTNTGTSKAVHSERALLMCEDSSDAVTPMKDLLNKNKGGCVVFYTYNSPCLKLCLNQARDDEDKRRVIIQEERNEQKIKKGMSTAPVEPALQRCILESLSVLTNHGGPKAFVFSRVYDEDLGSATLAAALKVVAEKVPLYKCDAGSCVKCLSNGQIIDECLNVKV